MRVAHRWRRKGVVMLVVSCRYGCRQVPAAQVVALAVALQGHISAQEQLQAEFGEEVLCQARQVKAVIFLMCEG